MIRLINSVSETRKLSDRSLREWVIISFRCCGFNPSGPPAEPVGKEKTAQVTSVMVITGGGDCVWGRGKLDWRWGGGCFSCNNFSESTFALHTGSVELTKRTAPLKSPSSNLAETLLAKEEKPLLE
jgi:hypothetical protein